MLLQISLKNNQELRMRTRPNWFLTVALIVLGLDILVVCMGPLSVIPIGITDEVLTGWMLGQTSVVAMLTGLLGRTWLVAWLSGIAIIMGGLGTIFACVSIVTPSSPPDDVWQAFMIIPWIGVNIVAPLVGARSFWGWSLRRDGEVEIPRSEHRLEDFFVFSIVAASTLVVAQMFMPKPAPQMIELIIAGMGLGYSLLFILPAVAVGFRSKTWLQRILGAGLLSLATVLGFIVFFTLVGEPLWVYIEELVSVVAAVTVTWLVGIHAILKSGYRLTRYAAAPIAPKSDTLSINPLDVNEEDEPQLSREEQAARREARWLTGLVAGVAMTFVFGTFAYDQWQIAYLRKLEDPAKYFGAAVSRIDLNHNSINGVVMSPSATVEDIQRVASVAPSIKYLSLAGTKTDDETLKALKLFPALQRLDLSGTSITDKGLEQLPQLKVLSLADTKVTWASAIAWSMAKVTEELDLSGIGVTDRDIIATQDRASYPLNLTLARNPITDEGVTAILSSERYFNKMDLSDTEVVGDSLANHFCPRSVVLDGTKVTDTAIRNMLAHPSCQCGKLSLRRTQVTAAVLPALASRPMAMSLRLGHGLITEADIRSLRIASFDTLALNGPEFTGESLTARTIDYQVVDLSDSSVTDAVLKDLQVGRWIRALKLSNTQVTMAGVLGFSSSLIDLRDAPLIRSKDIKHGMNISRLSLRHETCTPEEIVSLRKNRVMFDEDHDWLKW